jgi:hypothetical protein
VSAFRFGSEAGTVNQAAPGPDPAKLELARSSMLEISSRSGTAMTCSWLGL